MSQPGQGIERQRTGIDPPWSHVSETINMLYLAICQIEATLSDANHSVNTLAHSLTELANHTSGVSEQLKALQTSQTLAAFKQDISAATEEMRANVNASVEAFQFYDRVCQRLDHVARSLEKVSSIMEREQDINDPQAWKNLQLDIKSSYTMEAEHIMFEYIMRGGKVKDALEIYRHHFDRHDDSNEDDEIELF